MLTLMLRNKGMIMVSLGLLFLLAPAVTFEWLGLPASAGDALFLRLFGLLSIAMGSSLFLHAAHGAASFTAAEVLVFLVADSAACWLILHAALAGTIGALGYLLALLYLSSISIFAYVFWVQRRPVSA